jgi:hypothetical protein
MDPKLIRALNQWRFAQPAEIEPNAAILELLKHALTIEGYYEDEQQPTQKRADPALDNMIAAFRKAAQENSL